MHEQLYDELSRTEQSHWWFRGRREIVQSMVHRYALHQDRHRLRICELGCGTGANLASWADHHDVVGVDASPLALDYARRRLGARARFGRLPDDLPLPRGVFDVVLMTDVLEHVEDDRGSVRAALSLLCLGGILVATVPAFQWLYASRDRHHQHVRRYSKSQFGRLFDVPGVRLELLSFYNFFLFPPAAAGRLLSRLVGGRAKPGDLRIPPAPVNRLLGAVFLMEKNLLGRVSLPYGLSVITVARKSDRRPMAAAA